MKTRLTVNSSFPTNRRDFLKGLGAVASVAAVFPPTMLAVLAT